jgi:glycosyltransferase involved in cell wall biosynthesis
MARPDAPAGSDYQDGSGGARIDAAAWNMRVAYDHQIFNVQKHGGISRYFAELVQNLARAEGIAPTVIAPLHINEYLCRPGVRDRVRGAFFPFHFRGRDRVMRGLNKVLLPLYWQGPRFDIVHETFYSPRAWGYGKVRILTIYDMIHELFSAEFSDATQVNAAKRAAVSRADHVICISETTRQDAIRLLGIPPERTSVIYLGCSLDAASVPSAERAPAPCILYVGPRAGYKNFVVLLEAFAAAPFLRERFDLVTFGGPPFTTGEQRRIQELGVTLRVRRVTGNDALLNEYYRAAVAFVYPSRYEGFGIPPLEAMASGCPVACSNAGSISEVAGPAGAYFDPDDRDGLRLILERLAADPEYAAQLRAKGFEQIKKYSWAECASRTLRTYASLV